MARTLGFFDQWMNGEWADRRVINQNAQELSTVEYDLSSLQRLAQKQAMELLELRAMLMGVVEVLHAKAPFDDAELQGAVQAAWLKLVPPPPPPITDPYRGSPVEAAAPPSRFVTCIRCGNTVPAARTNITASGELCDACS